MMSTDAVTSNVPRPKISLRPICSDYYFSKVALMSTEPSVTVLTTAPYSNLWCSLALIKPSLGNLISPSLTRTFALRLYKKTSHRALQEILLRKKCMDESLLLSFLHRRSIRYRKNICSKPR